MLDELGSREGFCEYVSRHAPGWAPAESNNAVLNLFLSKRRRSQTASREALLAAKNSPSTKGLAIQFCCVAFHDTAPPLIMWA